MPLLPVRRWAGAGGAGGRGRAAERSEAHGGEGRGAASAASAASAARDPPPRPPEIELPRQLCRGESSGSTAAADGGGEERGTARFQCPSIGAALLGGESAPPAAPRRPLYEESSPSRGSAGSAHAARRGVARELASIQRINGV